MDGRNVPVFPENGIQKKPHLQGNKLVVCRARDADSERGRIKDR